MKKEYIKPAMQVVLLQHQSHLMQASGDVRLLGGSNDEKFNYDAEGIEDDDFLR